MKILVTGAAGFIGFHLVNHLASRGDQVVGIDNINDYYDVNLKYERLNETGIRKEEISFGELTQSSRYPNYRFAKLDLTDFDGMKRLFEEEKFDKVCNLAAQAGVRYSLINPQAYMQSNYQGFLNVLECCRLTKVGHLIYASSSSVYGLSKKMPFSESDNVDQPISLYAASKKSNELMAHTYSYLFGINTTGLRFFTVYGPWGRPDMAIFLFTKAISEGEPIKVFNGGKMKRDFTYIDDIIQGTVKALDKIHLPAMENTPAAVPYSIYNIGKGSSEDLMDFISEIEVNLGSRAILEYLPMQDGDVAETWADTSELEKFADYKPVVTVKAGVKKFVAWYKEYYKAEVCQ